MNWDYIAGLFDGEGNFSLGISHKKIYWSITPQFSLSGSKSLLESVRAFFESENIQCCTVRGVKNALGHSYNFRMYGWNNCKLVYDKLEGKVIEKIPHLQLFLKAFKLHEEIKITNRQFSDKDEVAKFDSIRHEIHQHAKKGRKLLKEYDFHQDL